jgi:hypothetical protein
MSLITKENIDIWMFNYHEELLSAPEKEQLLHFLIENPIYNEDFMLWANAHISPPKTLPITADITQNLLQKEGPLYTFPTKTITSFVGGICFACACMYIMRSVNTDSDNIKTLNTTQELKKSSTDNDHSGLNNTTTKQETVAPPSSAYISTKELNSTKNEGISKSVVSAIETENTNIEAVQRDSSTQIHIAASNDKDSVLVSQNSTEQQISRPSEAKTRAVEGTKKDKSKKNKFSLKPAKEFNVENPNF